MKKNVLLLTAAFAALSVSAQVQEAKVSKGFKLVNPTAVKMAAPAMVKGEESVKAPAKAAADNLYYLRPAGTFWRGLTKDFHFYKASLLNVPPFYNVVFENKSKNPTTTSWSVNGKDHTDAAYSNGDFPYGHLGCYDGGAYYFPTVSSGDNSFTCGEWNGDGSALGVDSVDSYSPLDVSGSDGFYGYGAMQPENHLYGNGYVETQSGKHYCNSVLTFFEKPAAPFYVEDIFFPCAGPNETLLNDGVNLTLTVYGVNMADTSLTEPIATLTASNQDLTFIKKNESSHYTTKKQFLNTLTFSAKGVDGFGNPTVKPFVIDQPFALVLSGLDQDGVNICFFGGEALSDDRPFIEPSYFLCTDGTSDRTYYHYYADTQILPQFTGCFDYVGVETEGQTNDGTQLSNINQLKVSADGQTVTNVGFPTADYALAYTAFDWTDNNSGDDNYTAELPDWISSVEAEDGGDGAQYLRVQCEALPEGTTGRAAALYFTGKGYTSENPVYVLQGDATVADAISSVHVSDKTNTDNRIYNLAGQQVSKAYKGIVIENGHKYIQK